MPRFGFLAMGPPVPAEPCRLSKPPVTVGAWVGLLSGVDAEVPLQDETGLKAVATFSAFEWPFSRGFHV